MTEFPQEKLFDKLTRIDELLEMAIFDKLTRIDELLKMAINQLSIISGVPPARAPFIIPISITELISTLLYYGKAIGYSAIDSLTIGPLSQVSYTIPVTSGYRAAIVEFLALPDPDHTLQMFITVDGKPYAYDDDMVGAIYTSPINYLRDYYHLSFALDEIEVTFINTSATDTATINFRLAWAEIRDAEWRKIVEKYYSVVEEWLLK